MSDQTIPPNISPNTIMTATTVSFAGVTIKDGKVTLPEGMTPDDAALAFWNAVDRLGKFNRADRELMEQNKPICELVWRQARTGPDDVVDYYEVAYPGDLCVDGSPPFPVWGSPNFFAKLDIAEKALEKIKTWFGEFPSTGKFWDNDPSRPMTYSACFGSNGERDYMRAVANEALNSIKANNKI